ncbi:PorT family protein [Mucilaginibacter limnophilus]|uniref:PorT family protein n=1 Tax=Mucilaginibacter limnophilus TaxID=1932778 RepID=A0A3S2WZI1_9SPHI|nr:porin family protein [Mucilaginibacter limnophilus]RVU01801.1 PorT family protein [Mucilaginibacter limnophilus]
MKKILFFAICLLVAGDVSAQYRRRVIRRPPPPPAYYRAQKQHNSFYEVKAGFKAGLNIANTVDAYDGDYSTSSLAGANIGFTLDVPIIYPLSFAPEILWSQKGFSANTVDGDFRQRNNFIDVPLLAKVKLAPNFNLVAGPQLSFLVSSKNVYRDGFTTVTEDRYDYAGNKTLLGGVIGLSVDIGRNVDLHARYTIDIQDSHADIDSYIPDYRNQVWQIGLGFKFR